MECLCPCYAWLKPWLCNNTNASPNTEPEDDDDDDLDEENGPNDPLELVELQRKLDRNAVPSPMEPVNTIAEKTTVVLNNHHSAGNLITR